MFESRNLSTARQAGHGAPIPAPAPPKGTGAYGPGRDTHLFDKFAVVLKYYKAVVVVFALVVAGMMYQTYSTIPLYRAQARIHIEEEHTAQTDFKDSYLTYQDPEPFYQTQYRILQGRDLARRAVRRLNLASVPEFNGSGPRPTRLTMIVETVKAKLLAPFRGDQQPASAGVPAQNTIDENAPVGAFSSRVQVLPVRGSRLVDVTFTSADPEFAARAVNVIAEEYVQQNLDFRLQNTEKTLQWLTEEVAKQ